MSRSDPKHGRWILPLVIAGLIGFTYLFVNALPPATTDTGDTDGTVATTDDGAADGTGTDATTGDGTGPDDGTVPSTTLPAEVAAFLTTVDGFTTRSAALSAEAQTINDDWDARTIDFGDARDALSALQTQTSELESEINDAVVPPDAADAWNVVIASSQTLNTAAEDMLDGLVNSSTSEKRLSALETFTTTAADLAVGFDLARSAVTG